MTATQIVLSRSQPAVNAAESVDMERRKREAQYR